MGDGVSLSRGHWGWAEEAGGMCRAERGKDGPGVRRTVQRSERARQGWLLCEGTGQGGRTERELQRHFSLGGRGCCSPER